MSQRKPQLNDRVHYVARGSGDHQAATVTQVRSDGSVNLFVLRQSARESASYGPHYSVDEVEYSSERMPGTWHWPEDDPQAG